MTDKPFGSAEAMISEHARHGRRAPYTEIGIRRLPCIRCGEKATQQWNICADGNLHRPICVDCDIAINGMVLRFVGDPDWKDKVDTYAKRLREPT